MNLGLRWEYNGVPSERYNRLGVLNFTDLRRTSPSRRWVPPTESAAPTTPTITDSRSPRIGFSWDPFGKGEDCRSAGAPASITTSRSPTSCRRSIPIRLSPPPSPIPATSILANPFATPPGTGSALQASRSEFQERPASSPITSTCSRMSLRYAVSGCLRRPAQGRHLPPWKAITTRASTASGRSRNLPASLIQESVSDLNYNGMWLTVSRRFSRRASPSTPPTRFPNRWTTIPSVARSLQIQNFRNIAAEYALSDFDACHRFVAQRRLPAAVQVGCQRRLYPAALSKAGAASPIVNLQTGQSIQPDRFFHPRTSSAWKSMTWPN